MFDGIHQKLRAQFETTYFFPDWGYFKDWSEAIQRWEWNDAVPIPNLSIKSCQTRYPQYYTKLDPEPICLSFQ